MSLTNFILMDYRRALSSNTANLISETVRAVYIKIGRCLPWFLISSLFTPCITKRLASEIGTSTPVVMPILKIKSGPFALFPMSENHPTFTRGKWWVISRCESEGSVRLTEAQLFSLSSGEIIPQTDVLPLSLAQHEILLFYAHSRK